MSAPSKLRSRIYAAIAGVGLSAVSYWLGTIHGATSALDQFRDLSFVATEASLRRAMRLDTLLAAKDVDGARRATMGAALSQYDVLEADAAGINMPATEKMETAIFETRRAVAGYCNSPAAAFHSSAATNICATRKNAVEQRSDR